MAEALGIASQIAELLSLTEEITRLNHSNISDIHSTHSTQKQYLHEISALTEVLLRIKETTEDVEDQTVAMSQPVTLSKSTITDCAKELADLRSELEKPSPSIFWPLKEKTLQKHVDDLHRFRNIFSDFFTTQKLVTVSATHQELIRLGHHEGQTELLDWIGNPEETSGLVLTPLPGTGEWFIKSDSYQDWVLGNGSSLLWCHGPPGVGKSMLASIALQHLSKTLDKSSVSLLHYFCDFANRKEQSKEAIWKSLLRQAIAQGRVPALQTFASANSQSEHRRPASSKDLLNALDAICSSNQVVIVVDGLDELDNVKDLKGILDPFIKYNCRILVTSRDLPEIRSALTMASALEVQTDRNDLRTYVASQFEEKNLEDLLEKSPELSTEIINRSNGIFLLGKFLVNHLLKLTTANQMQKALQTYPVHLEQAFEFSFKNLRDSYLANRVIVWITTAERKLSMSELIHGLATEQRSDDIDDKMLIASDRILRVCEGLVIANPQDGTVSMVHTTVYTWFRKRDTTYFNEQLARSCLWYLTLPQLSTGLVDTADEMNERMESLPLLSYAAQHWQKHVLNDAMEDSLKSAIDVLLENENFTSAAFQAINYKNHQKTQAIRSGSFDTIPIHHSALHIAAYWNLPKKVFELLANGKDLNSVDSQGWTPLHWACFGRSRKVVPLLILHGAEVVTKDSVGWTPLFWAVLNGDATMVELLLGNRVNYLGRDIYGWTALRWAAASQQIEIIRLVLKHHNNSLSRIHKYRKTFLKKLSVKEALCFSVEQNIQGDLLDEIQDRTINAIPEDRGFNELYSILDDESLDLSYLWKNGHFDQQVGNVWRTMSKMESHRGVEDYIEDDPHEENSPKAKRSALLHAAIRDKNMLAVRLLIKLGADVNHKSIRTPLHAATFRKDPSFAEVLLEHGAHIEALDSQGLTPLQQAVLNGFEEVTKFLLSKGANVNVMYIYVNRNGAGVNSPGFRTPLEMASTKTPLMLACGISAQPPHPDLATRMVRLLLENGADVNIKENWPHGMTAIHYAARSRNIKLLNLLIDAGADSQTLDNFGRTSVHHLVLGVKRTRGLSHMSNADRYRHDLPGMATACLTLLSQKCGIDYLSRTAEWEESYRESYNCWSRKMSIHTPLSLAIMLEDWELFQGLSSFGAQFETNVPLDPLLAGPSLALQPDALDMLIENGANFEPKETWMCYIFIQKLTPKQVETLTVIISKLIPRGLNINIMNRKKETVLHGAVSGSGFFELTKFLLKNGADPFHQSGSGLDSFILAGLNNDFDTLQYLLDHVKQHPRKDNWSQYLNHSEHTQGFDNLTTIFSALKIAGLINVVNKSGTLLCHAAKSGNTAFFQALLKNEADTNLSNEKGQTPLHFAAASGCTSIVEILINLGVDLDVRDNNERTPLHLSAIQGHSEVINLLLSNGASPILADFEGWQPLHFAAWASHTEAARCFIKAGASAQVVTSRFTSEGGWRRPSGLYIGYQWAGTPLELAAMAGNVEIVRLLLTSKGGININARTDDFERTKKFCHSSITTPGGGPTALHITLDTCTFYGERRPALCRDRLEIASILVENGASVQGVVDHLRFENIQRFKEFPELWDTLRAGISSDRYIGMWLE